MTLEQDGPIREISILCPPDKSVPGSPRPRLSMWGCCQTCPGFHRQTRAPEGSSGSQFSDSTNRTLAGEGMIQPAEANIPNSGVSFTKQMPSNDIHHTAHFT